MFKIWYSSYSNKSFISFNISITTCLCTMEIYQQMFLSNSFNGSYLMVLFNWGFSRLINKLSLIRSLNLFASEARISKWSKSIEQLHSSRWSDTADCLILLRHFPFELNIPICSAALIKKVAVSFTIISKLAVTTRVSVNNARGNIFLKGMFI